MCIQLLTRITIRLVSTSDKEACNKLDADISARLRLRDEAEGVSGDQVASKLQCIVSNHTPDEGPVAESALHILMCIDNPKDWTELYQVPIPPIGSDIEFFEFLRKEFKSRQSVVSWISLRGVISLSLKLVSNYSLLKTIRRNTDSSLVRRLPRRHCKGAQS